MFSANRCMFTTLAQHSRFSVSAVIAKSHYDVLGVTPKATQSDIKAAYYKLSMMYHPDKNKGSAVASEQFRAITAAYEILGNFKLRRLYDKGILHTAGPQYADIHDVSAQEDDDQTKFYKSRIHRDKPPTPTGRTPIYNFDEWSQAHYGDAFARKSAAKDRFDSKVRNKKREAHDVEKEAIIFGITVCLVVFLLLSYSTLENHDIVVLDESKHDNTLNSIPEKLTTNNKR